MAKRKKTFSCGHKGFGQICHRCAEEQVVEDQKKQEKQQWAHSFDNDLIDLKNLPTHVVLKARNIIQGLQGKRNYTEFGGKRLRHNRLVISIPVTRNYRMICHDCGPLLIPQAVLSHEDYNVCKPGG